jgi:DUF438 domain-containing protein
MNLQDREAPPGALVETLRESHRLVKAELSGVAEACAARRFSAARERLLHCSRTWERQVRLEEDLLYPLFELRLGTAGAGTVAMREEHRELRDAFGRLCGALGRERRPTAAEALESLAAQLGSHFSREERVFYPTLEAMLSDRERGRLLTRVESPPAERPAG